MKLRVALYSLLYLALAPFLALASTSRDLTCLFAFPPKELCRTPEPVNEQLLFIGLVLGAICIAYFSHLYRGTAPLYRLTFGTIGSKPWPLFFLALMSLFWLLAWSRFEFFAPLQEHSYVLLWWSAIAFCNALTQALSGTSLATRSPVTLLALAALSAGTWWFFEYLNRFTQNWQYLLPKNYTASEYFLLASLSFTTVLPAIASLAELLHLLLPRNSRWTTFFALGWFGSRPSAYVSLLLGIALAFSLGALPALSYPFVWLAPIAILYACWVLYAEQLVFPELADGNWQRLAEWMLASFCCGFLWEMWNFYSLAKWVYHIPFLEALHLFEMPILGYLGYLPFGVLCAQVAALLLPELRQSPLQQPSD